MRITKKQSEPENFGKVDVSCDEMMFYMYLPIKFPNDSVHDIERNIPERLKFLIPILTRAIRTNIDDFTDRYVYLTVKHTYVSPKSMSQRMGWHIDGFMTDDINYIWYSEVPTQFCIGDFDLSDSDSASLDEMESQVLTDDKVILEYPNKNLLRLKAQEVHRVNEDHDYEGMRTFVKISTSNHKFNLLGNSKNHLMDYNWKMYCRSEVRNMENNSDYV